MRYALSKPNLSGKRSSGASQRIDKGSHSEAGTPVFTSDSGRKDANRKFARIAEWLPLTRMLDCSWRVSVTCRGVGHTMTVHSSGHHGYSPGHACIPSLGRRRATRCPVRWVRLYTGNSLTNFDLWAFGKCARYSLKLPWSIRGEMVKSGEMDVPTPRRGNTFGWSKFFQVMISL